MRSFTHNVSSLLLMVPTSVVFGNLWSDESIINDNEVYSNDIYAILKTYGVEMAREAILREMSGVFGIYKIQVDRRHLELIADYMVCGEHL